MESKCSNHKTKCKSTDLHRPAISNLSRAGLAWYYELTKLHIQSALPVITQVGLKFHWPYKPVGYK